MHFVFNAFKTNEIPLLCHRGFNRLNKANYQTEFCVAWKQSITLLEVFAKMSWSSMIFCTRPWKSLQVGQAKKDTKTRCIQQNATTKPLHMFNSTITNKLISGTYYGWGRGIVWCILEALQGSEHLASLPASETHTEVIQKHD